MVCRFLLVSLGIDAILGEITISARRQKLDEMIKGSHLGDAYATTLARMKAQKGSRSRLGMEALMWVSNSERPLKTTELCHALGVKKGSANLDLENVPTIRTLLGCSLGLITVEASSSIVRLVHFTLQEYLSNNPGQFYSPHSMIAEVCLTYLDFRCIRELSPTLRSAPSEFPLVEYASYYWGEHTKRGMTESVTRLALRLLVGFEDHISSQLLLLHYNFNPFWWLGVNRKDSNAGITGLHGVAFHGISELLAALLAIKEWDINAIDARGRTALAWAALRGHGDVVEMLLHRKGVNPNAAETEDGLTPLLWAVKRKHEGIIKLLLEREDTNPNTADTGRSLTPLLWAVEEGHEGIVKLLLEREDTNPNTPHARYGQMPLWLAVRDGQAGVVKLLLEREDINPNTADTKYGRTPLWLAVDGGYEGIVKLLLEREDIDLNAPDIE